MNKYIICTGKDQGDLMKDAAEKIHGQFANTNKKEK